MKNYELHPGEGISGNLYSVGGMTTGLTSCMGILMINGKTQIGGLYHYPGKGLQDTSETRRTRIRTCARTTMPGGRWG